MRKYNWKKILTRAFWLITGAGTIVLLGAAMQKKDHKKCSDIRIEITGAEKHMFIDEKDVMDMVNIAGRVEGTQLSALHLRSMEALVELNPWVKNAEMYVDNKQVLQVQIEERQPVARVFTTNGASFYVDSSGLRLPLSEKISARVPVFTGFPSDKPELSKPDSSLLKDIVKIGRYALADSFWMAQVAQIDITPQANFEMVPLIGNHIVALGNADDIEDKFRRLYTFYTKAWIQNGMNTYETLDVRYGNQVVAIRKGAAKAVTDSARTKEVMNGMNPEAVIGNAYPVQPSAAAAKSKDTVAVVKTIVKPKPAELLPKKSNSDRPTNNKTTTNTLSNGNKQQPGKQDAKQVKNKGAKAVMKKS